MLVAYEAPVGDHTCRGKDLLVRAILIVTESAITIVGILRNLIVKNGLRDELLMIVDCKSLSIW